MPTVSPPVVEGTVQPRAPSPRARLAELALRVALEAEGVAAGHSGPSDVYVAPGPAGPLTGVVAAAGAAGRFDLRLNLVADPVPLHPLAERVRSEVARAARAAGLQDALGTVDVAFEDVVWRNPPEPPGHPE